MTGWKDWQIGEVVTESDFQNLVQDQVVQRYADASARSTTLGTAIAEGMMSYLEDTNKVEVFDGSSWVQVGQEGDITSVTAGTGLTGGGTAGDVTLNADYAAIGSAVSITASQVTDLTASAAAINTIDDGTAGYTALSNGTAGITYQPVSHNYIINGAFDISQRGTAFPSVTVGQYTLDRWLFAPFGAGQPVTVSQQTSTAPDNFENYARLVQESANATNAVFSYALETKDVIPLAGRTVTVSFYYRIPTSWTNTWQITLRQDTGTNVSAGSLITTGTTAGNLQLTSTTNWTRATLTATLASTTKSLALQFSTFNSTVSGATFEITGVQLEAGSVATPFKRHAPSLQGELAACQRYYYRASDTSIQATLGQGTMYSTTAALCTVRLPVTMRTAPTGFDAANYLVTDSLNVLGAGTAISINQKSADAVTMYIQGLSSSTQFRYVELRSSGVGGYIGFPAEL